MKIKVGIVLAVLVGAGVFWGGAQPASAAGVATIESTLALAGTHDNSLRYNAAYGPIDNRITLSAAGGGAFTFTDPGVLMLGVTMVWAAPAPIPVPNVGCMTPSLGSATCPKQGGDIGISAGDGNDKITVRNISTWLDVYVHCGAGKDTVFAYHPKVHADADCEKVVG